MNKTNLYRKKTKTYIGYAHIAFLMRSKKEVEELINRLRNDDFQMIDRPRRYSEGYYKSCMIGKEGKRIEVII